MKRVNKWHYQSHSLSAIVKLFNLETFKNLTSCCTSLDIEELGILGS